MKITNLAIDRSTTVFVLLALILVMGVYCYIVLPRESTPDIQIPYIVVVTTYEGVSPEDMESLVTVPIERKFTGIKGVKEITSISVEGVSHVIIEFDADTVIDDALQKVRDKVDLAKQDLPEEAEDPVVNEIDISAFPIMVMSLTGEVPLPLLNEIAEDFEDRLETIRGVLDVNIIGGVEREIQIEVDPSRVTEYGISFADLITITLLENANTPGGALDLGEAKYLMRTPGEFTTPEELNNLIVKRGPTGNVYMRDIATVKDGFKEVSSVSRVNGRPSVTLTVSKRSGQNIIEIADRVKAEVDGMLEEVPAGIDVALTWDESQWVQDLVSDLENSILSGLVLVVGSVFVFLGFVNALFVALAIPISMLITFIALHLTGVTLNMVVLFSLILGMGMLVDNGIVVVENIYRHAQEGMGRKEAARIGTAEVAWPVTASTLTTVAAFFPLLFWPGIMGEFMFYLPETVSLALLASLFVGLVVNPTLMSVFARAKKGDRRHGTRRRHAVLRGYASFLRLALRWRAVTVTLAGALLVVISGVFFMTSRTIFMPEIEPPQATIDIDCPEGTNLETSSRFVEKVEAIAAPYQENIEFLIANVGSQADASDASLGGKGSSSHLSAVTLDFLDLEDCKIMPSAVLGELRGRLTDITGADVRINKMEMGPPTGPPINVEITGEDFETLAALAQEIREEIKHVPGLVDLRDDYNKGKPEVRVVVDRERAWQSGLNTKFIGLAVKAAVDGRKAGDYREGDEEYDVTVRFPSAFRENLTNIEDMNLVNLRGEPVPFSSVARLAQGAGLGSIRRIDRKRTVTVSAEVTGKDPPPKVLEKVQEILEDFPLPAGYSLAYTGENEDMQEARAFLVRAFVVALFLIALVLVTQFNSVTQPLVIMSAVVLSLAGVFLGLLICNMPFGILMTGVGCISLAGVVVNNGIVLIDFVNQLRAKGMPIHEAIVEAGIIRFRPVLLTAGTTILGLIPMAIGVSFDFRNFKWLVGSETSQFWGSMAVSVIFGLSFATLLTLVVVPTLYSLNDSLAGLVRRDRAKKVTPPAEAPAK